MQQKENLSAYMDGQNVEAGFADTLLNSPELKQKWANYHTIRSVMQGEEMLLGADFSAKMEALLENETIEKAVENKKPKGVLLKLKRWSTPIMQAGIAASVCLVAVLGVNMFNNQTETAQTEPALQTLPFSSTVQSVSYNAPTKDLITTERLEQQQRRIDALLLEQSAKQKSLYQKDLTGTTTEEKAKAQTSSTQK